jgi:hypothetical protein
LDRITDGVIPEQVVQNKGDVTLSKESFWRRWNEIERLKEA